MASPASPAEASAPGAPVWRVLTVCFAVLAVLASMTHHAHDIDAHSHNHVSAPTPDSGQWALAHGANAELSEQNVRFLAKGKIHFAETAFVRPGRCDVVYATDSRGRVWALSNDEAVDPELVAHVGGTLLGGAFDADGGIYVADSTRGLIYLAPRNGTAFDTPRLVSTLAPSSLDAAVGEADLDRAEIRYCNDIAVDRRTGLVYFTDSTKIAPVVSTTRRGDTFYSYASCQLSGDASGRLLVYDPTDGSTHVLVTDIPFANGVGVSADGKSVIFASTATYTVRTVPAYVAGVRPVRFGETKLFYDGKLPGLPDGLTVDQASGDVYVPVFGPIPPVIRLADRAPNWLRRVLVSVPQQLRPKPSSVYSMIVTLSGDGELKKVWHDSKRVYGLLTSVERCGSYLYCGALKGDFAARFDVAG